MHKYRKRIRLVLLAAMALCLLMIVGAGMLRKKPPPSGDIPENVGPGVSEGRDIHITRDQWEIWLRNARLKELGQRASCNEVKLVFHSDDGREVTLTGDTGEWDQKKMEVEVEGDVVVTATGGYSLRTTSAQYLSSEKLIIGHGIVEITGPGFQVSGREMRVELDPQRFILSNDVLSRVERRNASLKAGG